MQTSASVDADIRVGRYEHPRRSVQTSASVDAEQKKATTTLLVLPNSNKNK
jgi:hypothetical protein